MVGIRRIGSFAARHPRLVDAAFTLFVMVLGLPSVVGPHPAQVGASPWLLRVLQVGLTAPLFWRRRRPTAVFFVIAAVAIAQWSLPGGWLQGDVALLIALYGVAAREPFSRLLPTVVAMEVVVVAIAVRWVPRDWAASIVLLTATAGGAVAVGTAVRFRRDYLATLIDRAERLEIERDHRARLAVAAERSRIAREMHDIVAHNLSVMIGLADGARYSARDAPDHAEQAMEGISTTGRQAMAELRRLLDVLREDHPVAELGPQPGLDDLDDLVERVRGAGLAVELRTSGARPPLSAGLQLAIYRITQESLTNTLKHGGREAAARVRLRYRPDVVEVEIVDTGHLTGDHGLGEGRGIAGMTERASVYGGTVEAGPGTAGGWRVHASFGIQPTERNEMTGTMDR